MTTRTTRLTLCAGLFPVLAEPAPDSQPDVHDQSLHPVNESKTAKVRPSSIRRMDTAVFQREAGRESQS
jgi:hypothetical protein